jgi:hypothetical protein
MRGPSIGSLISAVAAVLLIVCLFLDWFEPGFSAWTTFEVWDIVLAALGLAVLVRLASELAGQGPGRDVPLGMIAAVVLVVVVVALINHPPAAVGRDIAVGAWLALGAAVLLVVGALLADAGLTITLDVDRSRRTDPPAPPADPPAAEPRPGSTGTTRRQP